MGVGGLLKDVGARPLPRAKAARPPRPRRSRLVVLAAGRSSRMAPRAQAAGAGHARRPGDGGARGGQPAVGTPNRPILVVTGHRAPEIEAALAGRPVQLVHAARHADGLSASLRAGLAALPPDTRAVIVCLGDMPLVTARVLQRLVDAYDPDEGRLIVAPTWAGAIGNPILWDSRYVPEMMALTGDRGARALLERHAEHLATVNMDDDAVLTDVDTPAQWAALPAHLRPAP